MKKNLGTAHVLETVLSITISKNGSGGLCLQKLISKRCWGFHLPRILLIFTDDWEHEISLEIGFLKAFGPKNRGIYRGGSDTEPYLETGF